MGLILALLGCPSPTPTPTPTPTPIPAPLPTPVPTADTAPPTPPVYNLLWVLIDDVSPDRLTRFDVGAPHDPHTPAIDGLADQGRLFRRAYASPVCSPTRASLLTGRLPSHTGVGVGIFDGERFRLDEAEVTLPEALPASWSTGAFGKWHLASLDQPGWMNTPNVQGFDTYLGSMKNLTSYNLWLRTHDGATTVSGLYATQATTFRARDWMQQAEEPWFAYVAYHAAHEPLHVPPDDWRHHDPDPDDPSQVLDAMIESVDIGIGHLLDGLDPDVRARTFIVVMGDNGTTPAAADKPSQAKSTLHEGGIRVPLIIAGPGIEPGDTEALANITDLFPTSLALLGLPSPEVDGVDLSTVLEDPSTVLRRRVYQELFTPNGPGPRDAHGYTLITPHHKLLVLPDGPPQLLAVHADTLDETPIEDAALQSLLETEVELLRSGLP